MSGGIYNYLCYKDISEIFKNKEDIFNVSTRLEELGYKDLGNETKQVYIEIERFFFEQEKKIERLQKVWRAVEWYDSGDIGIDTTIKILESVNKIK